MKPFVESATSLTLLGRLRQEPTDQKGWDEFVQRYGKVIKRWLRGWGLQEADAMDVTQMVMVALSKQMRTFEYKPSGKFRNWLRTVAYRAWCDFLRANRGKLEFVGNDENLDTLLTESAQTKFLETIENECTKEILELAMKEVQSRVNDSTWQAFHLLTYEKMNADEVAESLGMTKGAVFVARGRVRKMLSELMDEEADEESSEPGQQPEA